MDQDLKVRENKVRRAVARRGWTIEKSRKRDPNAIGFGLFSVFDKSGVRLTEGPLDAVEKYLGLS